MDIVAAVGADEEAAAVVDPGERALDDPAVAAESGAVLGLSACDQRLDAPLPEQVAVLIAVVAAVGDQGPRSAPGKAGPRSGGTRSSSSSSSVTSLRLPPVSVQARGIPVRSTSRWCLLPARPRSTELKPVLAPPFFRLQMACVGEGRLPLELTGGMKLGQQATRITAAPLPHRQQRLDPLPQPIRQLPRLCPHRHPPRA